MVRAACSARCGMHNRVILLRSGRGTQRSGVHANNRCQSMQVVYMGMCVAARRSYPNSGGRSGMNWADHTGTVRKSSSTRNHAAIEATAHHSYHHRSSSSRAPQFFIIVHSGCKAVALTIAIHIHGLHPVRCGVAKGAVGVD